MPDGYLRHRDSDNPSRRACLREVLLEGPVTRKEIAARLGFKSGTVSRLVRPLIDAGIVQERTERSGERPVRPGRRFQPLAIAPQGGQVLGIAITPTVQTVALADIGRNILASSELQVEPIREPDHVIRRLAQESRRLIGTHLQDRSRLFGGLLMVAGAVDPIRGAILESPYLGWGQVQIRAQLADLLNLPMQIRMLLPTIGQAEVHFGAARARSNVLVLLCGLGIGAAVLVEGRFIGDSRFPTGPIGMMTVVGEDGAPARFDDLAGGPGILRQIHGEQIAPGTYSHIDPALHDAIERDRKGDPKTRAAMARAGRELGRLVVQHGHFAAPELVLIAGPLANSPGYMAAIQKCVDESMVPHMEIVASSVTGAAGGWWASCAMAVYEYLIEQPLDLSNLGVLPE